MVRILRLLLSAAGGDLCGDQEALALAVTFIVDWAKKGLGVITGPFFFGFASLLSGTVDAGAR